MLKFGIFFESFRSQISKESATWASQMLRWSQKSCFFFFQFIPAKKLLGSVDGEQFLPGGDNTILWMGFFGLMTWTEFSGLMLWSWRKTWVKPSIDGTAKRQLFQCSPSTEQLKNSDFWEMCYQSEFRNKYSQEIFFEFVPTKTRTSQI